MKLVTKRCRKSQSSISRPVPSFYTSHPSLFNPETVLAEIFHLLAQHQLLINLCSGKVPLAMGNRHKQMFLPMHNQHATIHFRSVYNLRRYAAGFCCQFLNHLFCATGILYVCSIFIYRNGCKKFAASWCCYNHLAGVLLRTVTDISEGKKK